MAVNRTYTRKDFTGKTLTHVAAPEFDDSTIVGSCFAHEHPGTAVFPAGITGVVFDKCNLDNVDVPATCTVLPTCSHRRYEVQHDEQDWAVDRDNLPVSPLDPKLFDRNGWSKDPADLPATLMREATLRKADYLAISDGDWEASAPTGNTPPNSVAFWYREKPAIQSEEAKRETLEVRSWNGTDQYHFDSVPALHETVTRRERDPDTGEPILVTIYVLAGLVTYVTVRGAAWRYRGE